MYRKLELQQHYKTEKFSLQNNLEATDCWQDKTPGIIESKLGDNLT